MKQHDARKVDKEVQPVENWLIIFKQDTLVQLLIMQHAKGRSFHAGTNTTITNVYKTLFVHKLPNKNTITEEAAS
jgi:hypothetical protein